MLPQISEMFHLWVNSDKNKNIFVRKVKALFGSNLSYEYEEMQNGILDSTELITNLSPSAYIEMLDPASYIDENDNEETYEKGDIKKSRVISQLEFEKNSNDKIYNVEIYRYKNIKDLDTGCFFGDIGLSSLNKKRTATIITSEETDLGVLDYSSYEECIKDSIEKVARANMNFIMNTQIFINVNKILFNKYYQQNFVSRRYTRGNKLIKEGDRMSNIFFLKSGEYELTINLNLLELSKVIIGLGGLISFEQERQVEDLMSNNNTFKKFMHEKRLFKILILKENDIAGLPDIILDNKYICTLECLSNKGEVFSLDYNVRKIDKYNNIIYIIYLIYLI